MVKKNKEPSKHLQQAEERVLKAKAKVDNLSSPVVYPPILCSSLLWPTVFGVALRWAAFAYFKDYLQDNVSFTAPWTSFRRLKDALYLWERTDNLYADKYHGQPWLAFLFYPIINNELVLQVVFISFDVLGALFLYIGGFVWMKGKDDALDKARLMFSIYMLNPLAVGICAGLNITTYLNMLLSFAFCAMMAKRTSTATLAVCVVGQLNPFYAQLLLAIPLKEQRKLEQKPAEMDVVVPILKRVLLFVALYALNFLFAPWIDVINGNLLFFLNIQDCTPNMGLWWYLFIEMFAQYRLFYLATFQMLALLFVFPLFRVFHAKPAHLWLLLLQLVAYFSSYPTYAEFCAFLPLLVGMSWTKESAFPAYFLGTLVVLACSSGLLTLQQWLRSGAGNANFFFGSVTAYLVALNFLFRQTVRTAVHDLYALGFGRADPAAPKALTAPPLVKCLVQKAKPPAARLLQGLVQRLPWKSPPHQKQQ